MQQNDLLAIFIGLIGGFVLVASLIGGISASPFPFFVSLHVQGTSRGWLSFHLGMLMNGMMALVLERTLNTRAVSRLKSATICWADMERQRIKERCDAGRLAAQEALARTGMTHRGKTSLGRPKAADPAVVREWRRTHGASIRETMAHFGISKNTVTRYCATAAARTKL